MAVPEKCKEPILAGPFTCLPAGVFAVVVAGPFVTESSSVNSVVTMNFEKPEIDGNDGQLLSHLPNVISRSLRQLYMAIWLENSNAADLEDALVCGSKFTKF